MNTIRRAFVLASAASYATALIGLATTAVVSRLITPHEFGIAAVGLALFGIAEAGRDLGLTAYIVQSPDLTQERLRTVFTLNLIMTSVLAIAIAVLAPVLAGMLAMPGLDTYLHIALLAFLVGAVQLPLHSLLARDLDFKRLGAVTMASSFVNAVTLIVFAALQLSFLSFALATVASHVTAALLLLYFRPMLPICVPCLEGWRHIVSFGAFSSGSALLHRTAEYASLLILAKILTPAAVGLLHRASMICNFPERTLLAGVNAIALPAFSAQMRQKEDLAESYLSAVQRLTVFIWPALGLTILLAHPLILVFLGGRWLDVVPLVQIIAGALLLNVNPGINYPLIIATGSTRYALYLALVQVAASVPIVLMAAYYGIQAVAWSAFIIVAFNVVSSTLVVHRVVRFPMLDLCYMLWRSAGVSFCALALPVFVVWRAGGTSEMGIASALAIAGAAALGWLTGLWLMQHPFRNEVLWLMSTICKRLPSQLRLYW